MFTRRSFLRQAIVTAVAPTILRAASSNGFEIGLVADAQYADVPAKGTRFYRESIGKLGAAVEHFNGRDLAFCVHLGDLIDREWKSFDDITKPLGRSRQRWHQLLGNHDFDVLDQHKADVPKRLGMTWRYGSFDHAGFRFAVLDTNDVSTYAHAVGKPERTEAERELARLEQAKVRQAKPWTGGVSSRQLAWLERTCAEARQSGMKVIILAHHPVFPESEHLVWNSGDVLSLVDRQPNIVAWINGHNHAGAYGERNGVPYLTMHGMVETSDTTAFATARVLADRIVLAGHGRELAREMKFRNA